MQRKVSSSGGSGTAKKSTHSVASAFFPSSSSSSALSSGQLPGITPSSILGRGDSLGDQPLSSMTEASASSQVTRARSISAQLHYHNNSNNNSPVRANSVLPDNKTVCDYCGVSYLTMSELRALQTKVKDQEERLTQLKDSVIECNKLKETLTTVRKSHRQEVTKRDEECQRWVIRCTNIESELEKLKGALKESEGKNSDLAQKYAIASEDFKQQEEVICQLRNSLQSVGDVEADAKSLRTRNSQLEENLQKLLQEIKSLRSSPSGASSSSNPGKDKDGGVRRSQESHPQAPGFSTTEIALKAKIAELTERCSQLSTENIMCRDEITSVLRKQQDQSGGDRPRTSSKLVSSVVSVEIHDLKRENAILSSRLQSVTDEHSNCQDMHSFLRESIEKLKSDNVRLVDEMNGVKVKYEESLLKIENFQAVISGYQSERNRFMNSYKELQTKTEQLAAQNRAFHKSSDPQVIENLRATINAHERQLQQLQAESSRAQLEFESKLSEAQREVTMEKERADSCLTQSLTEREDVEKRWQERWARHHTKLTDQLEILKTNYEGSLKCAKEREDGLQAQLQILQEKHEKTKRVWEEYKAQLLEQMESWRARYDGLEQELVNVQKGKVDVELMFQQKTQQLEELHETVRQGCEERQYLQRRAEELERDIQEASFSASSVLLPSSACPPPPPPYSSSTIDPTNSSSASTLIGSSTKVDEAAWKQQSQSVSFASPRNSPNHQQQQSHGSSKSSSRHRPSSPFPVMMGASSSGGGKGSSSSNFTVGSGKSSVGNNSKPVVPTTSSTKESSKSGGKKTHKSSPMVFSVSPPNVNTRKANRNFEEALWHSFNELEPVHLVKYLFRLRDRTSKALKELPVKTESDKSIACSRFFLFMLSKNILAYGMSILGIKPLEQI